MEIVNDVELLGDPVIEHNVVLKFFWSVPQPYRQMVMAIESLLDLKTSPIEELTGRLLVIQEHNEI